MGHDVVGDVVGDAEVVGGMDRHCPLEPVVETVGSGVAQTLVAQQVEVHTVPPHYQRLPAIAPFRVLDAHGGTHGGDAVHTELLAGAVVVSLDDDVSRQQTHLVADLGVTETVLRRRVVEALVGELKTLHTLDDVCRRARRYHTPLRLIYLARKGSTRDYQHLAHLEVYWLQRNQSCGVARRRGVAEGPHTLSGRAVDVYDPAVDPRNGGARIGRGGGG